MCGYSLSYTSRTIAVFILLNSIPLLLWWYNLCISYYRELENGLLHNMNEIHPEGSHNIIEIPLFVWMASFVQ